MPRASSATDREEHPMSNDDKQQTPGYREENPKPSHGKPKVPGEGHPQEHQNMPNDKPGKQGS
jgi:hypothetical protein